MKDYFFVVLDNLLLSTNSWGLSDSLEGINTEYSFTQAGGSSGVLHFKTSGVRCGLHTSLYPVQPIMFNCKLRLVIMWLILLIVKIRMNILVSLIFKPIMPGTHYLAPGICVWCVLQSGLHSTGGLSQSALGCFWGGRLWKTAVEVKIISMMIISVHSLSW